MGRRGPAKNKWREGKLKRRREEGRERGNKGGWRKMDKTEVGKVGRLGRRGVGRVR